MTKTQKKRAMRDSDLKRVSDGGDDEGASELATLKRRVVDLTAETKTLTSELTSSLKEQSDRMAEAIRSIDDLTAERDALKLAAGYIYQLATSGATQSRVDETSKVIFGLITQEAERGVRPKAKLSATEKAVLGMMPMILGAAGFYAMKKNLATAMTRGTP